MQGEGPYVGASTLFVRLGACDLRCRWCDSPHTWQAAETCRIQVSRGSSEFREVANPVPVAAIAVAAEALEFARHAFVAAGLPEQRLYYDSFDYAPDVLAAILGSRAGLRSG